MKNIIALSLILVAAIAAYAQPISPIPPESGTWNTSRTKEQIPPPQPQMQDAVNKIRVCYPFQLQAASVRYAGDTLAGKAHGKGKALWLDDKEKIVAVYVGEFQYGFMSGQGKIYYPYMSYSFTAIWNWGDCSEVKSLSNDSLFALYKPKSDIPDEEFMEVVEDLPVGDYSQLQSNLVYPDLCRRMGIEGTVYVRAYVRKDGQVVKCEIDQSDNRLFNISACKAVLATSFKPAKQGGQAVHCQVSIPIKFMLR